MDREGVYMEQQETVSAENRVLKLASRCRKGGRSWGRHVDNEYTVSMVNRSDAFDVRSKDVCSDIVTLHVKQTN